MTTSNLLAVDAISENSANTASYATQKSNGNVRIYTNDTNKYQTAQVYVHDGSSWKLAIPYLHNGTTWKMVSG